MYLMVINMSIHNLLIGNDFTLKCKQLDVKEYIIVDGTNILTYKRKEEFIPVNYVYSGGASTVTLEVKAMLFTKVGSICFITCPELSYNCSSYGPGYFALDLTGLSNTSFSPREGDLGGIVITQDSAGSTAFGSVEVLSSGVIHIYNGPARNNFTGGSGSQGLPYSAIITYRVNSL